MEIEKMQALRRKDGWDIMLQSRLGFRVVHIPDLAPTLGRQPEYPVFMPPAPATYWTEARA